VDAVKALKEKANSSYKASQFDAALAAYEEALAVLEKAQGASSSSSKGEEDMGTLEVSLHYNRAACLWKLSRQLRDDVGATPPHSSSSSSSSSGDVDDDDPFDSLGDADSRGVFELLRCEQACLAALAIMPLHVKSAYRLASTLLLLGKPQQGLETVDGVIKGIKESSSSSSSSSSSPSGVDITGDDDKLDILRSVRSRCVAAILLQQQKDSVAGVTAPSAAAHPSTLLNPKAAKILQALQMRKKRETDRITSPWSNWEPPAEEFDEVASNATGKEKDDNERGASADDGNKAPSSSAATLAEMMSDDLKSMKKTVDASSTSSSSTGKTSKKATSKTSSSAALSNKAADAVKKIRAAANQLDSQPSATASVAAACLEGVTALWGEKVSIKKAFKCLEEGILLALLACFVDDSGASDDACKARLVTELVACDRFDTNLRLALYGNDALKGNVTAAVARLDGHIDDKVRGSFL